MTDPKPGAFIDSLSSAERKQAAMSRGLLAYFPDALALVARHSVRSNEKHNPGQPVHWSREKSTDHEDCVVRHSASIAIDPNSLDDGQPHMVCRAWRALAALQLWAEAQQKTKPKGDGWHSWSAGRDYGTQPPVASNMKVEVEMRDGTRHVGYAAGFAWFWGLAGADQHRHDIIRYRRVG